METKNKTTSYNPATGKGIGESELHTVDDLNRMVAESKAAQEEWKKYQ